MRRVRKWRQRYARYMDCCVRARSAKSEGRRHLTRAPHSTEYADAAAAPTSEEIAQYNIILFVSIGLVLIFYFASMALVGMEHTNDSLLYSKSKSD